MTGRLHQIDVIVKPFTAFLFSHGTPAAGRWSVEQSAGESGTRRLIFDISDGNAETELALF